MKSYRVAKYLLSHDSTSQSTISEETNVAIGYVNEVLHHLEDLNIVKIDYGETKLTDYARLLEKISMDRPFKQLTVETIRLPTTTVKETEQMITRYCRDKEIKYAYTGFTALNKFYTYHITYPLIQVYIETLDRLQELEKGEGAIPVTILRPDRSDILTDTTTINETVICEKTQVIIDLYSSGLGRDAAINYIRDTRWRQETSSQNNPTTNSSTYYSGSTTKDPPPP